MGDLVLVGRFELDRVCVQAQRAQVILQAGEVTAASHQDGHRGRCRPGSLGGNEFRRQPRLRLRVRPPQRVKLDGLIG